MYEEEERLHGAAVVSADFVVEVDGVGPGVVGGAVGGAEGVAEVVEIAG